MKNVLILGGGYGSLSFIKQLKAKDFQDFSFTLITKESSHYTSVLLHKWLAMQKTLP